MIYENILQTIGHTPLIRLNRVARGDGAEIYVKLEGLNAGGSVKTRTAYRMIREAEERGELKKGDTIVEPTSGNQGIGLALAGATLGYKTVIVMPDSVGEERKQLIELYGAEVVLIHDRGNIGECIKACIAEANRRKRKNKRVFMPNQFENTDNVRAHEEGVGREILKDAPFAIDGFCCGIGTGGTLTGVGRVLKRAFPAVEIWAAEPENAALLSGGCVGAHRQTGIGDGVIPPILDRSLIENIERISDGEAIETARLLARCEGIACGISSGTNVACAKRLARRLGRGKRVVTVLPDGAERYYSSPLFDLNKAEK